MRWLTIIALLSWSLSACQKDAGDSAKEPEKQEQPSETTPDTEAETQKEQTTSPLEEVGRVDMVGFVFGVDVDPQGLVMVTTRDGRTAAYAYHPDDDPGDAPAALELAEHAHTPFAVGDGLFALPQTGAILIVRIVEGDPRKVEVLSRIDVSGEPADVALQYDRMWVASRQAEGGKGLVVVDPRSGVVVGSYFTGAVPIELTTGDSTLFLTVLADNDTGEVFSISGPDPEEAGTVQTSGVAGIPMRVAPTDSGGYLVRDNQANLMKVGVQPLSLGDKVELPFAPRGIVVQNGRALISDAVNRLASVPLDGGEPVEAEVGKGTVELHSWGQDHLLVVDAENDELLLLESATLDRVAAVPLKARGGKIATDESRNRVYVTVPDRGELLVAQVSL